MKSSWSIRELWATCSPSVVLIIFKRTICRSNYFLGEIRWFFFFFEKCWKQHFMQLYSFGNTEYIQVIGEPLERRKKTILYSSPSNKYLLKIKNSNTRKRCEICSELITKTPKWRHWLLSGVFIVYFEHISHLFLVFILSTLNR